MWIGPDGKSVVAALNATSYSSDVTEDLTKSPTWIDRVQTDGKATGVYADYRYYGTGDVGGAPREASVKLMEAIIDKAMTVIPPQRRRGPQAPQPEPPGPPVQVGDGPLHVLQTTAEQMFLDLQPSEVASLPKYTGDLELTEHSAGSLTSEAYMKRWNRKNELLADAAERASVAADWMGGRPYPLQRLTNAWTLVMGGQFHDIIPGTATPKAFEYAWNDQVLAMNQFAGVLDQRDGCDRVRPEHGRQGRRGGGLQSAEHRAAGRGGSLGGVPAGDAESGSRGGARWQGSARTGGERERREREGGVPGKGAVNWIRGLRCAAGRDGARGIGAEGVGFVARERALSRQDR